MIKKIGEYLSPSESVVDGKNHITLNSQSIENARSRLDKFAQKSLSSQEFMSCVLQTCANET